MSKDSDAIIIYNESVLPDLNVLIEVCFEIQIKWLIMQLKAQKVVKHANNLTTKILICQDIGLSQKINGNLSILQNGSVFPREIHFMCAA